MPKTNICLTLLQLLVASRQRSIEFGLLGFETLDLVFQCLHLCRINAIVLEQVHMRRHAYTRRWSAHLAKQLRATLLPHFVLFLQARNVALASLQLRLRHANLLPQRLDLGRQGRELGVQRPGALALRFGIRAQRRVALPEDGQLIDLLHQFRVLCIGRNRGDGTFAFLNGARSDYRTA